MRQVISISLPPQRATQVQRLAVRRGYHTVSNYIAHLIQDDANLISEEQLLRSVKQARAEYRMGKVIHAKSLDELI